MHLIIIAFLGSVVTAIATASSSYYIVDAKHGRSLVAGNRYDGNVYHQDPTDRPNAKWVLETIEGEDADIFLIRDTLHKKYIVAGDHYDGKVYHQAHNNRSNAKWRLVPFTDKIGSQTFHLIDQKHGKAIIAGGVADNHVYHQPPGNHPNARWALVPNSICF